MDLTLITLDKLNIKLLDRSGSFANFYFQLPKYLLIDFIKEGAVFSDVVDLTPHLYYVPKAYMKKDKSPIEKVGRFMNASLTIVETFNKGYESYKAAIAAGMNPYMAKQLLCNANIVEAISSNSITTWRDIADRLIKRGEDDTTHYGSTIKALLNESSI